MLVCIPNILSEEQVSSCKQQLLEATWIDGKATAGSQSAQVKFNSQLEEGSELSNQLGDLILNALADSPIFTSAALPLKTFPPLFNKYEQGGNFGAHIDNAIRNITGSYTRLRTDLSATLFFSDPDEYDGGELIIEDNYGTQEIKLKAGDMVLYPSSSLHQVTPVTRGARISSFFWVQSMIRDDGQRTLLYDLDQNIQTLVRSSGESDPTVISLSGIYHNLIRRWADT